MSSALPFYKIILLLMNIQYSCRIWESDLASLEMWSGLLLFFSHVPYLFSEYILWIDIQDVKLPYQRRRGWVSRLAESQRKKAVRDSGYLNHVAPSINRLLCHTTTWALFLHWNPLATRHQSDIPDQCVDSTSWVHVGPMLWVFELWLKRERTDQMGEHCKTEF